MTAIFDTLTIVDAIGSFGALIVVGRVFRDADADDEFR